MTLFVLTALARRDLEEIWDYHAAYNHKAAECVLNEIEAAIRKLVLTPSIGHPRERLADRRHYLFPVCSYLIVYRPATRPVEIIRVLPASWDTLDLLGLAAEN